LGQAFQPEAEFANEIVLGRAYTGKERPVRWRAVPRVFPYGWVDLGSLVRPEQKVCGYLTSFIKSKAGKSKDISAWVGASGAFKVFWNGRQILQDTAYRGYDSERFATRAKLDAGYHNLTVKVCAQANSPNASVRVAEAGGHADPGLGCPEASERARD